MNNVTRWVVIAAVVFIGIAGFTLGKSNANPKSEEVQAVATDFVNALVSGDVDKTYSLSSQAYQARNTKEYVKTVSDTLKSDNPLIADEEVFFGSGLSKGEAIYLNSVDNLPRTDVNSSKGSFVIRLIKEDGKWKVDSSQVY